MLKKYKLINNQFESMVMIPQTKSDYVILELTDENGEVAGICVPRAHLAKAFEAGLTILQDEA